jgi:acetylornithine deacetylase/succinyl-diaminopimelate desuccinylase-like protein
MHLASPPPHPLAGYDQVNVGIVAAGDYPNRLPVEMRVTGTRRWGPGRSAATVRDELAALAERAAAASGIEGLTATVALDAAREPFETATGDLVVQALRAAGARVGGQAPQEIGLALVGDASLYANELRLPVAYYGPGYETAHSDAERVSIDRLVHIAGVYALTALMYCGS